METTLAATAGQDMADVATVRMEITADISLAITAGRGGVSPPWTQRAKSRIKLLNPTPRPPRKRNAPTQSVEVSIPRNNKRRSIHFYYYFVVVFGFVRLHSTGAAIPGDQVG